MRVPAWRGARGSQLLRSARTRALTASLLGLIALTCSDPRVELGSRPRANSTAPVPPSARERFEPPARDGWGSAGALRYLERTLGGGDSAKPLPMVIMIHGLGDKPRFDWFNGADAITTPMRLIMPQAPTPHNGGFAWFPFRVGDNDPDALARGIASAADELARSIELLRARRPTLGQPIVTGFSQGGMLSYALALRHPKLFELSHPISGMLPEPLWPIDKPAATSFPRIVAIHGDADDVVPIEPARQLCKHLSHLGYAVSLREFAGVRHQITPTMDAYTVQLLDATARSLAAKR
jgi:phospholipase/carboxylesterase